MNDLYWDYGNWYPIEFGQVRRYTDLLPLDFTLLKLAETLVVSGKTEKEAVDTCLEVILLKRKIVEK